MSLCGERGSRIRLALITILVPLERELFDATSADAHPQAERRARTAKYRARRAAPIGMWGASVRFPRYLRASLCGAHRGDPQITRGGEHSVVVGHQLAEVPSEQLGARYVDGVERSQLGR